MPTPDAQLRFQTDLIDNTSVKLDALQKKLQAMGATPTQIKMIIQAVDQSTSQVNKAHEALQKLPKETVVRIKADTDQFHRDLSRLHHAVDQLPKEHTINITAATGEAHKSIQGLKDTLMEPFEIPMRMWESLQRTRSSSMQGLSMLGGGGGYLGAGLGGANTLLGLGAGGAAYGVFAALDSTLKQSIQANSELQQQMMALTVAVRDSGTAQEQMNTLIQQSNKSIFSRSDLANADITAQQFNLPVFKGQSTAVPQGVMQIAQNIAAANQTNVSTAMTAVAYGSQGYYRGLKQYGIPINDQDFQTGGRFSGLSPLQAISQSASKFEGAPEAERKTVQGMVQEFKNQWENKIIEPLGHFAFAGLQTGLGGLLQKADSSSGQRQMGIALDTLQDKMTLVWTQVQKGVVYFKTNLQQPLENIGKEVIKLSAVFGKVFSGTLLTVLSTVGKALLDISSAASSIVQSLGPLGPAVTKVFAVAKAFSVLGFGNISSGLVAPMKDLASLRLPSFFKDLFKLPLILGELAVLDIGKKFLDAHNAAVAMNSQFKGLGDHLDNANVKIDVMAKRLGGSATAMKETMAEVGKLLGGDTKGDKQKFNLSEQIVGNAQQLHNTLGANANTAAQMIAKAVDTTHKYTTSTVTKFSDDLTKAAASAKDLGMSFDQLTSIVAQNAGDAQKAGLGGLGGAQALVTLQGGANRLQRLGWQPNANELVTNILQGYRNVPADQMINLITSPPGGGGHAMRKPGAIGTSQQLSQLYNFTNNPGVLRQFVNTETGPGSLAYQSKTSQRSIDQMDKFISRFAPAAIRNPYGYGISVPANPLAAVVPNVKALTGGSALQNATASAEEIVKVNDAYAKQSQEVQNLQVVLSKYQQQTQQLTQAQDSLNLTVSKFTQDTLVPLQRKLEDSQLALSNFQLNSVTPLQMAMENLNQEQAQNSNIQQNAQWYMSKYTEGLTKGQQAAQDQAQAMKVLNDQIAYMQLQYQQIGAQLGTTVYDKGAEVRINPLAGISLAYQQQELQRKQQMQQLKYDSTYGQQQYELQKAARPLFERETIPYQERMKHIKELAPVLDKTNQHSHDLENSQFKLSTEMFNVNRQAEIMSNNMQRLQNHITAISQSPKMRKWADEQWALNQQLDIYTKRMNATQTNLGIVQNALQITQQEMQSVMKLFDGLMNPTGKGLPQLKRVLDVAVRTHIISDKDRKVFEDFIKKEQHTQAPKTSDDWKKVIAAGIKEAGGLFTGSTERDLGDTAKAAGKDILNLIPFIGHPASKLVDPLVHGAELAGTAFAGITALRVGGRALRYGAGSLLKGGLNAAVESGRIPETHILDKLQGLQGKIPGSLESKLKHLENLDANSPGFREKEAKRAFYEAQYRQVSENLGKSDLEVLSEKLRGGFKEIIHPLTKPLGFLGELKRGAYEGIAGGVAAVGTAALTGSSSLASVIGGVVGKVAGFRQLEKIFSEAYHSEMKISGDKLKAEKAGELAAERFRLGITDKAGKIIDHTKDAATAARDGAKDVRKSVDAARTHIDDVRGSVNDVVKVTDQKLKDIGSDLKKGLHLGDSPHGTTPVRAPNTTDRARELGRDKLSATTPEIKAKGLFGKVGSFLGKANDALFGAQLAVGDATGNPAALGTTALGIGRTLTRGGLKEFGASDLAKMFGKDILGFGGAALMGVQLANVIGPKVDSGFAPLTDAPVASDWLKALRSGVASHDPKQASVAKRTLTEIQKVAFSGLSSQSQGATLWKALGIVGDSSGLLNWSKTPGALSDTGFQPGLSSTIDQIHKSLQTAKDNYNKHFNDVETASQGHWTAMTAMTAVFDKNDIQGLQSYLQQHLNDHKSTYANIIQYAQTYYGNYNTTTDQGFNQISGTTQKWLKKLEDQVHTAKVALGLAQPHHGGAAQSTPATASHGSTTTHLSTTGQAHGVSHASGVLHHAGLAHHLIRGKGDGKGYLAHVGEEGDELIIPLSPHRRERARHLIASAAGLVGGMKHAHHPKFGAGGYTNPFPAGATTGRADQGVDYNMAPGSPIEAIGDSKYIGTIPNWYKGQPFAWYELMNGKNAGKYYYIAEQIANIQKGMIKAGHPLANYASSGTGLEMGWATAAGQTLAMATTGYTEGQTTPAGANFGSFIAGLSKGQVITAPGGGAVSSTAAALNIPPLPHELKKMGYGGVLMYNALKHMKHQLGAQTASMPSSGSVGTNWSGSWVQVMKQIAASKHWNLGDWKQVVNAESGGDPRALNPSSGAFGIGQFLGSTLREYAKYGATSSDPVRQIEAMAQYISDRYGNPTQAWAHEQSNHWYANGALIKGYAGGHRRVTRPHELALLHQGERVLSAAETNVTDSLNYQSATLGTPVGHAVPGAGNDAKLIKTMEAQLAEAQKLYKFLTTDNLKELHDTRLAGQSLDKKTLQQKAGNDLAALNAALRKERGASARLPKTGGLGGGSEFTAALISNLAAQIKAAMPSATTVIDHSEDYKNVLAAMQAALIALPKDTKRLVTIEKDDHISPTVRTEVAKATKEIGKNEARIEALRRDAKDLGLKLTPQQERMIHHLQSIDKHLEKSVLGKAEKGMSPGQKKEFEGAFHKVIDDIKKIHLPADMHKDAAVFEKAFKSREMITEIKKLHASGISARTIAAAMSQALGKNVTEKDIDKILGLIKGDTKNIHLTPKQINETLSKLHKDEVKEKGKLTAGQKEQLKELMAHKDLLSKNQKERLKKLEEIDARHDTRGKAKSALHASISGLRSLEHGARLAQLSGTHTATKGTKDVTTASDRNRAKAEAGVEARAQKHHNEQMAILQDIRDNPPRVTINNSAVGASLSSSVSSSKARSR